MNKEKGPLTFSELNSTLEKMIELEKTKKRESIGKIILLAACSLSGLIILVTLCLIFYKNEFSMESLISLLLAFFSIFISIFFYFKAAETSNQFYETSYDFMKDVSVTLGKIEERFGEKLNSLNDKMSHLSAVKEEKTEELQTAEDEKQKLIDELMDKAKLSEEQRDDYQRRLKERERDVEQLQSQLRKIERQAKKVGQEEENPFLLYYLSDAFMKKSDRNRILRLKSNLSNMSTEEKDRAKKLGLIDEDGNLTSLGKLSFLEILKNMSICS